MKASLPNLISYLSKAKFTDKAALEALLASIFIAPESFFLDDAPTYQEVSEKAAMALTKRLMDEKQPIRVTTDVSNEDIEENSIAYHRIFGSIIADENYWGYFSTKRFIDNIEDAEENPNIIAHFLHVSSGGGEAWLLDKAFEAVKNTNKPVVAFIEKVAASAGYYLIAPSNKIYCYTQNDTIGSIGTMVYFLDFIPYYLKQGVVEHEEYATKSDLKNKKFNELLDGKPKRYINEELDPLQQQFEADVRSARPVIAKLPADHPVVRGETFTAPLAIEVGLVDEIANIDVAVIDAYNRGMDWRNKITAQKNILNFL